MVHEQRAALADIRHFLSRRRLAIVGVSRNPRDFTRSLFREFASRGYDVVPVHPGVEEIEGHRCYARIQEIAPPVDAVLVLTAPAVTNEIVHDCAEAGVREVWMHRASGSGAVSPEAIAYCEANGIHVIPGECPFMFLPDAGFPHGVHGFVRRITGRYPH
ncbi:MAG TPA: CoA-binding protein [Bryobacteraceae bacterium]